MDTGGQMNYKCFECGTAECIQHHHVVPRSVGGTKTIPLCSICHGKVHGIKRDKQINVSELTKAGIARARAAGKQIGNPDMSKARINSHTTRTRRANEFALSLGPEMIILRENSGLSWRKLADNLNNQGIKTRHGYQWQGATVRNVYWRYKKLLEDK